MRSARAEVRRGVAETAYPARAQRGGLCDKSVGFHIILPVGRQIRVGLSVCFPRVCAPMHIGRTFVCLLIA